MKHRKRIALILCLAMLLSLVSACGSTTASTQQTASASEAQQKAQPAQEGEAAAPSAENTENEESDEMAAASAPTAETTYPLTEELETLTAYAPIRSENQQVVNEIGDFEAIQLAESITNVHVEWSSVPETQYQELCPIMVAGGDYADLIYSLNQGYGGGITRAYSDEVIINLTEYMDECAPNYCALLDEIDYGWSKATTDAGDVLAFYTLNSDTNQQGVLIRGDWLDEQNLQIPETVDEFVDMLYQFQEAYGVAPLQMSSAIQEGMLFTSAYDVPGFEISIFGSGSYWYQVDGVVKCGLIEPGYQKTLKLLNQFYADNIFSRDFNSYFPGSNDSSKNGLISNGTVGVLACDTSMVDFYQELLQDLDGAYFVVAKNPVLNSGDMIHFGRDDSVSAGSTTTSVSTQCENVELAVKWLDFWYSPQGIDVFNYGIEGKTYTVEDGTPVFTDIIENNTWGLGYTAAINTYCPIGNIASYNDVRRFRQYYSDLTLESIELWSEQTDLAYVLPQMSLTDEESTTYNENVADIETYAQESVLSFITGTLNPDSDWDTYVDTITAMGIPENQAIYQTAFDRLNRS